jgi:hypothetical protein
MNSTTATTAIIAANAAPIEPRDMTELRALAQDAAASRFYGAASPEQALMLLVTGRDLGLSYSQSLRAFHVVQGKPVLSSAGMVAVCLRSGVCEYFRVVASDDTSATVEVKRRGDPARRVTFTLDDARRAGLANRETWKAYPSRMLLARAQAFAAREVFPDLLLGLYDPDEAATPAAPVRGPVRPVEVAELDVVDAVDVVDAAPDYAAEIAACDSLDALRVLGEQLRTRCPADQRARLRSAFVTRRAELDQEALRAQGINPDAEDA